MPVVNHKLNRPGGTAMADEIIHIRLLASSAGEGEGFVATTQTGILSEYKLRTDSTGTWTITLTANALITPANTTYQVIQPGINGAKVTETFIVPNGDGPYWLGDILAEPPAGLPGTALAAHDISATPHAAALVSLVHAPIRMRQRGADPTGVVDAAPIFNSIQEEMPTTGGREIEFGDGVYKFDSTMNITKPLRLIGPGGDPLSPALKLLFPADVAGMHFSSVPSTEGASVEGMTLEGSLAGTGDAGVAHGIVVRRPCTFRDVGVLRFNGHGVMVDGQTVADLIHFEKLTANVNRIDGVFMTGADANACTFDTPNTSYNGRWGINDRSFLGNHYHNGHTANNGVIIVVSSNIMSWTSGSPTLTASADIFDSTWVGRHIMYRSGTTLVEVGGTEGMPDHAYIGAVIDARTATVYVNGAAANFTATRTARNIAYATNRRASHGSSPGRVVSDVVMTNGSTTITSATAAFTQADRGMGVASFSNSGLSYRANSAANAYIERVVDATTAILSVAPNVTASGVTCLIGLGGPYSASKTTHLGGVWSSMYSEMDQYPSLLGGMNLVLGGNHGAGFHIQTGTGGPAVLMADTGVVRTPAIDFGRRHGDVQIRLRVGQSADVTLPDILSFQTSQQDAANGGNGRSYKWWYDTTRRVWHWRIGSGLPVAHALVTGENTLGYQDGMSLFPNGFHLGTGVPGGAPVWTDAPWIGAGTAAPTTGTWKVGDRVLNRTPSVLGTAGSQYVIEAWACTVAGTPGTWVAQRTLTGT